MILQAKELSSDQKLAIESLLGRALSDDDQVSVRAVTPPPAADWLRSIQEDATRKGLDTLTMDEIDAEIAAARRERGESKLRPGT